MKAFMVHLVFFYILGMHRLKSSQADVERDLSDLNAPLANARQGRRGKVKSGGGSGNAAGGVGMRIDGLVALSVFGAVLQLVWPSNIRREWNVSQLFYRSKEIGYRSEPQSAFTEVAAGDDFGGQLRVDRGGCKKVRGSSPGVQVPKMNSFSHV